MSVKTAAPYEDKIQTDVYLDPRFRAKFDDQLGSWKHTIEPEATMAATPEQERLAAELRSVATQQWKTGQAGVGIDLERTDAINIENSTFVDRNFTSAEVQYCSAAASPRESFTGRWCAKEAVIKAITDVQDSTGKSQPLWKSGGDPLKQIEILPSASGAPIVVLHDAAAEIAEQLGVHELKVTITHSGGFAVAQAAAFI